jgi:hypothetical protein
MLPLLGVLKAYAIWRRRFKSLDNAVLAVRAGAGSA